MCGGLINEYRHAAWPQQRGTDEAKNEPADARSAETYRHHERFRSPPPPLLSPRRSILGTLSSVLAEGAFTGGRREGDSGVVERGRLGDGGESL